jgi:hypothetical protein
MESTENKKPLENEDLLRAKIVADMKDYLHGFENRTRIRMAVIFFMIMLNVVLQAVVTTALVVHIFEIANGL